jgi:hypothetical protein
MDEVRRAGRQLEWIVTVLLVLSPVAYVALFFWKGPDALLAIPEAMSPGQADAGAPATAAMLLVGALTPLVYWLAFYFLRALARLYAQGHVFTPAAIANLRRIGLLLLATDFVHALQTAITGPVLSALGLVEGYVVVELRLGMSVVGLFIILVSRVMEIAADLDEQRRLTI